ncbi:NADP-dependent oxidoreductase [Streptomyces malaysiensis]|uniref:NADP-dependent oxidoreductase n=1 Tax=Streptomyces malaysiensis TaxID=92644 RepID=UPI003723204D
MLQLVELPTPDPGRSEIRIRTTAAAVNPTDTILRQHGPRAKDGLQPPWIPGMELAGVVDAVGEDSVWSVGDRVMAIVRPRRPLGGAQAEFVVVPDASAAAIPDEISDVDAATLPMNGLTVFSALLHLRLTAGQTLGVTGAAGAVGGYAVQLARVAGLHVIADAFEKDTDLVQGLGPAVVVRASRDAAEEAAAFRAAVPEGVDGLIDAAVLNAGALPIVRDGGALAAVRFWTGPSERDIRIHPVNVSNHLADGAEIAELAQLVVDGRLTLRVADTYPVAQAAAAHQRLQAGGTRGRLVLTF